MASFSPFVAENTEPENRVHAFSISAMGMLGAGIIITATGSFSGYTAAIQVMLFCYVLSTFFWWLFFAPRRRLVARQ